jgi:hypothetical protein
MTNIGRIHTPWVMGVVSHSANGCRASGSDCTLARPSTANTNEKLQVRYVRARWGDPHHILKVHVADK